MLHGAACTRVNGVAAFLLAVVVEIAIVSAGGHTNVSDCDDLLQLRLPAGDVVGGFGDAYMPFVAFGVHATADDLASDLHQIVFATVLRQHSGHHIAGLSFSHCAGVQHNPRIGFDNMMIDQLHFVETYE